MLSMTSAMRDSEHRRSRPSQPCTLYVATRSVSLIGSKLRTNGEAEAAFHLFPRRTRAPVVQRDLATTALVVLENIDVRAHEFCVEDIEVRLLVQRQRPI